MKRLFAFGCSYTSYGWPTWANLISNEFDKTYNWGLSGIGNRAIAERVSEANARYQFNENDTVIVQWSSHLRNDFWHMHSLPERKTCWKTSGSIFNYINESLYDKKWIDTFFFEPAYFMHTLNHISLTQGLLKSTGATWYMTSIGDIRNMGADLRTNTGHGETTDFLSPYDFTIDKIAWKKIPDLEIYNKPIWEDHADHWINPIEYTSAAYDDLTYTFIDTSTKESTVFRDTHPSVRQHQLWVEEELCKKISISQKTIDIMNQLSNAVEILHQKFRFDKHLFEMMVAKREGFPHNVEWPLKYEGF